jgi:hypothetical protein
MCRAVSARENITRMFHRHESAALPMGRRFRAQR